MRIACVDRSAANRVELQRFFDDAYQECRTSVGHIKLAQTYPASKDESLVNSPPDLAAIGPNFTVEEAFITCRELKRTFPTLPIFLFLKPNIYTLRTLRRFEKVADEIFTENTQPIGLIHKLSLVERKARKQAAGKLIVCSGVKGGVGTTTIVSGFAHAAEALGKNAIVIDLSLTGAFIQYMGTERWQSPEFSSLLQDNISPDHDLVKRFTACASNGVNVLLPPSGGTDIRELWLRDAKRFEITLAVVDILRDLYDLVLVDTAGAEGLLNFALNARADTRLLISSNDPASVHLLNDALSQLADMPGNGSIKILLNCLRERGLTKDDILDFLYLNEAFAEEMSALDPVPFDSRGKNWIGTGNSFYTESTNSVQQLLEAALESLMLAQDDTHLSKEKVEQTLSGWRRIVGRFSRQKRIDSQSKESKRTLLALPDKVLSCKPVLLSSKAKSNTKIDTARQITNGMLVQPHTSLDKLSGEVPAEQTKELASILYEPPRLVGNSDIKRL